MESKKAATDIVFSLGIELATRLRGLIFIPVISGTLGVAAFGAYTQIIAIASFLELVFGLGLYSALVRYGQRDKYDLSDLYYSHTVVAVCSASLVGGSVIYFAPQLSDLTLGSGKYTAAFRVGSVLIMTRVLIRIARNYFRVNSRIKTFSTFQGLKAYGLVIAVTYVVLFLEGDIFEVILSMVIVEVFFVLLINGLVVRELGVTIPTFPDIGEHLKYGMPLSVSALAGTLSSRVDRILIGFFLGASAVGVYSIAYQLAIAISVYVLPIRQTFFPEFSRLIEKGDAEQCVPYLKKGVRYFLLLSVPSVGGMYLIGPSVVQRLIGDSQPLPSNILMALIAGGILFSGLDQIYGVILTANERTDRLSAIRMVGAIGNLFLNLLLIQWFGVIGAAVATLVTYMLTSAAVFQEISVIKPPFSVITFIRTALAASAMVAGIWLLNISSIWLTITAGVLVYFSISFLLGEIEPNEIKSVLG